MLLTEALQDSSIDLVGISPEHTYVYLVCLLSQTLKILVSSWLELFLHNYTEFTLIIYYSNVWIFTVIRTMQVEDAVTFVSSKTQYIFSIFKIESSVGYFIAWNLCR
jgi:hypothetical protein